jgi:hypothetical protein
MTKHRFKCLLTAPLVVAVNVVGAVSALIAVTFLAVTYLMAKSNIAIKDWKKT